MYILQVSSIKRVKQTLQFIQIIDETKNIF